MRPNFLLFITDQQRADHLGCYGNPIVRTPAIDAIARNGWLAEEFYTATPICMPNRASLMTGRMPSRHGVRHNGIELTFDETTFVEVLRAAGYATAHIGNRICRTSRPSLRAIRAKARRAAAPRRGAKTPGNTARKSGNAGRTSRRSRSRRRTTASRRSTW